jgi:hypothetical protein
LKKVVIMTCTKSALCAIIEIKLKIMKDDPKDLLPAESRRQKFCLSLCANLRHLRAKVLISVPASASICVIGGPKKLLHVPFPKICVHLCPSVASASGGIEPTQKHPQSSQLP